MRRILATSGNSRHACQTEGLFCAKGCPQMKSFYTLRLYVSVVIACLAANTGCRSLPTTGDTSPAPSTTEVLRERDMTLIQADSEVFEAVVRAQLATGDDDYPHRLDALRIDARPYGTQTGYPENFAGVQGIDPTLTFGRAGQSEINDLVRNRQQILESAGAPAGRAPAYRQCAGAGVPTPPPARGAKATRAKSSDVHAGCPKAAEYYLTVGLPVRGQPAGLENARDVRGRRVSLKGDVWTALIDEHAAGPRGWTWSQYAWVFRRNRAGKLELENAILIGVTQ